MTQVLAGSGVDRGATIGRRGPRPRASRRRRPPYRPPVLLRGPAAAGARAGRDPAACSRAAIAARRRLPALRQDPDRRSTRTGPVAVSTSASCRRTTPRSRSASQGCARASSTSPSDDDRRSARDRARTRPRATASPKGDDGDDQRLDRQAEDDGARVAGLRSEAVVRRSATAGLKANGSTTSTRARPRHGERSGSEARQRTSSEGSTCGSTSRRARAGRRCRTSSDSRTRTPGRARGAPASRSSMTSASDTAPKGQVIAQDPGAGTTAPTGSTVTLDRLDGPETSVPNVTRRRRRPTRNS